MQSPCLFNNRHHQPRPPTPSPTVNKQARRLEGELEVKLQALAKLAAGLDAPPVYRVGGAAGGGYGGGSGSGSGGAGGGFGAEQLAAAKASEIEALLGRLSDVHGEMAGALGGGGDARGHTLARHRDVLQEYAQEFRRLEAAAGAAARDRAELFSGAAMGGGGGGGSGGEGAPLLGVAVHNASGALLRERTQIAASANYVDDMLAQAASVSRGLMDQRRVFDGVQDKLFAVGERFPAVNGLLNAIRRKKSRDALVLSAVVAGCTVFLVVYVMFW